MIDYSAVQTYNTVRRSRVFGDTLNRFHFSLTHPVTLESSHGLLVKCRGEDVCLMGNPSEIIIYK